MSHEVMLAKLSDHAEGMKATIDAARSGKCSDEMLWEKLEEHCKEMALLANEPEHEDDDDWGFDDDDAESDFLEVEDQPAPFVLVKTDGF